MKKNAFTLIELSMVLVIVGLIIGGSAKVFKSTQEHAKVTSAKKDVQVAKNAILGYAITTGFLPTKAFFSSDLSPVKGNQHQLLYTHDTALDTKKICAFNTTPFNIQIDHKDGSTQTITDVAFSVVSESANNNLQTGQTGDTLRVRKPYEKIDDESSPVNIIEEYDDIVEWVTLNELKSAIKCESIINIVTNHIPILDENISKKIEIFTDNYEVKDYNWSVKLKNTLSPSSSIKIICNGTTNFNSTSWSTKKECNNFTLDINFTTNEPSNKVDINVSDGYGNSHYRSYGIELR
jgi:prepilin-type N-terminal cleavage/methylation domain-containing protein